MKGFWNEWDSHITFQEAASIIREVEGDVSETDVAEAIISLCKHYRDAAGPCPDYDEVE